MFKKVILTLFAIFVGLPILGFLAAMSAIWIAGQLVQHM